MSSSSKAPADAKEKTTKKTPPLWATLSAGLAGGTVSRTLTAPLDRVKVLVQEGRIIDYEQYHPTVQVRPDGHKKKVVLRKVVRYIYREGGFPSFWKGNGVNCMKAGPEFGIVFAIRQRMASYSDRCTRYNRKVRGPKTREESDESHREYVQGKVKTKSLFFRSCAGFLHYTPGWAANILIGAVAGGTAQTIMYPLELVKTRMAVSGKGEYLGVADCIKQTYRKGGAAEFYRGLSANLTGIIPYRGLEVGMFFTIQQSMLRSKALMQLQQEAEEVERLQTNGESTEGGNNSDSTVHHQSGEKVSSNSASVDVSSQPPAPKSDPDVAEEPEKYKMKKQQEIRLTAIEVACVGTGASVVAQTVTYPLNLVRTRLQTQGVNGRPILYTGMVDCFRQVLSQEGPRGLFHGLSANYLKAVPASAITFVVFDRVQGFLSQIKL